MNTPEENATELIAAMTAVVDAVGALSAAALRLSGAYLRELILQDEHSADNTNG